MYWNLDLHLEKCLILCRYYSNSNYVQKVKSAHSSCIIFQNCSLEMLRTTQFPYRNFKSTRFSEELNGDEDNFVRERERVSDEPRGNKRGAIVWTLLSVCRLSVRLSTILRLLHSYSLLTFPKIQ